MNPKVEQPSSKEYHNPASENFDCWIQITTAISEAKAVNMPPEDFWSSFSGIFTKYGIGQQWALETLVDVFLVVDTSNAFFVNVLRWHNENSMRHYPGTSIAQSSPSTDVVSSKWIPPVTKLIGSRLEQKTRRLYDEQESDAVYNLCTITAILIKEGVVNFWHIWSFLKNEVTSICRLESRIREGIDASLEALKQKDPVLDPINDTCFDEMFMWRVTFSYDKRPSKVCAISIYILKMLWTQGVPHFALELLCKHKYLALCYFPSLYDPFWAFILEEFGRPNRLCKFRVALLAASVLGPRTGKKLSFFEDVCTLCALSQDESDEYNDLIDRTLIQVVLPALSLNPKVSYVSCKVWHVLAKLDLQRRFKLYYMWWSDLYESELELKYVAAKVEKNVTALMEQLTEASLDHVSKCLAHLAMTNPIFVWKQALGLLFELKKPVPAFIDSIVSHSEVFSQDAIFFVAFDVVRDNKSPFIQTDNIIFNPKARFISTVLKSLFTSSSYIRNTYLAAYLELLAGPLSSIPAGLIFLSDLLTGMFGTKLSADLADNSQIMSLGGSKLLRRAVLYPMSVSKLNDVSHTAHHHTPEWAPHSVAHLLDGFRNKALARKLLTALATERMCRESVFLSNALTCETRDKITMTLQILLSILTLGDFDIWDGLPALTALLDGDVPISVTMEITRLSLRKKIENQSSHFVEELVQLIPCSEKINPKLFVLFWSLEAYDVCVPDPEYDQEVEHLNTIREDTLSPVLDSRLSELLKSLEESHVAHRAHVAWLLPQLPTLDASLSDNGVDAILNEMVIPRIVRSRLDAHYVFCFLSRTLMDPMPFLNALFDNNILHKIFSRLSELEGKGFSQFLCEVLLDVSSWSNYWESQALEKKQAQENTREDHVSDTESWDDTRTLSDGNSNDPEDSVTQEDISELPGALSEVHCQTALEGNDSFKAQKSQSPSFKFVDSDTDPTYTLFRHGAVTRGHLQQWEDNIRSAMSKTLMSCQEHTVRNVLSIAGRLSTSVPQLCALSRSLSNMHPFLLEEENISQINASSERA